MSQNNNPCFNLTHIYYGAFCGNFYTDPWRGFGSQGARIKNCHRTLIIYVCFIIILIIIIINIITIIIIIIIIIINVITIIMYIWKIL